MKDKEGGRDGERERRTAVPPWQRAFKLREREGEKNRPSSALNDTTATHVVHHKIRNTSHSKG